MDVGWTKLEHDRARWRHYVDAVMDRLFYKRELTIGDAI